MGALTNHEIYREWKQAKDPGEQVTIIADMEFRSKKKPVAAAIMEQCEINNDVVPLYIKRLAGLNVDDDLKMLVEQGMTQREIAHEFRVSLNTVKAWLQKAGLKTQGSKSAIVGGEVKESGLNAADVGEEGDQTVDVEESIVQVVDAEEDAAQARTSSDEMKVQLCKSVAAPLVEMASVIAECAAKLGKGEIIISAYPGGSCSIIWNLEARGNEKM